VILQALAAYYDRKVAFEAGALPQRGWERKRLPFLVEIRPDGSFVQLVDTRELVGSKPVAAEFLVPQGAKRAYNIAPSLLWDNVEYVLGFAVNNDPGRVARAHAAFRQTVLDTFGPSPADEGVAGVLHFLNAVPLDALQADASWPEVAAANPFITFRLVGDPGIVCRRPDVAAAVARADQAPDGRCLVTGDLAPIARLHASIKGVRGANTMGASIVSFNLPAFESHGRTQGSNAPVGVDAAFRYTTALNALLHPDSKQRQTLGDTTFVYWAERPVDEPVEQVMSLLFSDPVRDDPDRNAATVEAVLASVRRGGRPETGSPGRFFVLGLAPNAARLAIRVWITATAAEIATRITRHFDDLEIVRPPRSHRYPTLYWLLRSVAALGRAENIPPLLEGEVSRAILEGRSYPASLLSAAVGRCRAEQDVTPDRAALIKAVINRLRRSAGAAPEELTVALDPANPDHAYRLGRLFAALERAQELASPGLNATIRDRFYGAASSTPITVFPRLLSLKNHHVAKIESTGLRTWIERLMGEIVDGLPAIPAHLSLEQQGAFAVGYYHQRQDFFRKRTTDDGEDNQA
jgi:CRISPR-associated protein Csd1